MNLAIPGFFSDVRRWSRANTAFSRQDGMLAAYCAAVWVVCVLAAGYSLSASLSHSPLQPLAVWILIAVTAWTMLPPLQLMVRQATVRSLLRRAVYSLSLVTGTCCLAYLYGVWTITHSPGLLTGYFWEITLPSCGLIAIGLVGIIVSGPRPAPSSPAR
nr:hypothetical protein [Actinomyces sp.]